MTLKLFREDGYLKSCEAVVTQVDGGGFATDQTVFYPMGGGQPGDTGLANGSDGVQYKIADTRKDRESGQIFHYLADGAELPRVGDRLTLEIEWDRRHRLMRMHSCMHMLCVAVPAAR